MSTADLEIRHVAKRFGGNAAVNDCSFSVRQGSITGVIGPNGAGKSTLFNMVGGLLRSDAGEIVFGGQRIDALPAHRIARLGIARTFQTPREILDMTLLENLMLVPENQWGEQLPAVVAGWRRVRAEEDANRAAALEVIRLVELQHQTDAPAGTLSIGQKKLLELARCLLARPKLALLDEPTAGVNPRLIGDLIEAMRQMSRAGVTLLIIEHNMNVVMNLCEHVVVLHQGRVLREGTPAEIQTDRLVQDAYLGAVV
jgi:ABC-type branched-subunit amino acid transport system ATPase component